jgi:hypothetical protein
MVGGRWAPVHPCNWEAEPVSLGAQCHPKVRVRRLFGLSAHGKDAAGRDGAEASAGCGAQSPRPTCCPRARAPRPAAVGAARLDQRGQRADGLGVKDRRRVGRKNAR